MSSRAEREKEKVKSEMLVAQLRAKFQESMAEMTRDFEAANKCKARLEKEKIGMLNLSFFLFLRIGIHL